jgi:hypothetical protein
VITKKHAVPTAGKRWLSGGRELDLKVVCRRGVKNYLSDCHCDVPQFLEKPCKSNSDKKRECMHIKYSIGCGSLVKPDGFTNIC